jgi:hypothetical protein
METKTNESSSNYALRCAETIVADRNVTEQTILVMFLEYRKRVLKEFIQNKK